MNTIEDLTKLGVEYVYAGHCTGLRAEAYLLEKYKERFRKMYFGFRITFK